LKRKGEPIYKLEGDENADGLSLLLD